MLINRRTYHNAPGKFLELLALAKEIKQATKEELNKDVRISSALFGPLATLVLEIEYQDAEEEARLSKEWYALIYGERNIAERLRQVVESAHNELWHTHE